MDIIKPKALNASDWRSELVQIDEKYKYLRGGNPKNLAASFLELVVERANLRSASGTLVTIAGESGPYVNDASIDYLYYFYQ